MIYEQLLPAKGTSLEKIKRLFQIIGFLHFFFGFVFFIFLIFIHWKLAIFPLCGGLLGCVWGSLAYLFSYEYKYTYNDGVFCVYRLNSYNKYKLKLSCNVNELEFVAEEKGKKLTNKKDFVTIKVGENAFLISPDDYMLSLLKNGKKK